MCTSLLLLGSSGVADSASPWTAARQASPSITISQSLLRLMSISSVMPSNHLILCHPIFLPSIFPSNRVFSSESALCIRCPKYWTFGFSSSLSDEYSQLISFRIDWLYFLAVQGTLKSLLQHHSSKASILRRSAFFMVRLSHPYMTTGKTIALIRQTFVDKVACCGIRVAVLGGMAGWHKSFWRSPLPHHSLASGQTTGRERSPTHQQKIGLRIH